MPGAIVRVRVGVGDPVVAGQPLLALEAMKMEHQVLAPTDGIVAEVLVAPGDQVEAATQRRAREPTSDRRTRHPAGPHRELLGVLRRPPVGRQGDGRGRPDRRADR
jgi:propionyl-CoA carboxylase alpha chain